MFIASSFQICLLVYSTAHQCLHHVHSSGPHFIDKLKDIEVIFLLQSLQHCIKSDECAGTTHTSTGQNAMYTSQWYLEF